MARVRAVEVLAGRRGLEAEGKPVEPPIVLSLLTAWNFMMQQLVLCGPRPT